MNGEALRAVKRRKRAIEACLVDLENAHAQFALAVSHLYDTGDLSHAQIAEQVGLTRARIHQLVKIGRGLR